jgi:hypothetical protein
MANAKLNQIVAVEKGVKNGANTAFTKAYQSLGVEGPFQGMTRTYQPRHEDGDKLPDESTKVQTTVDDKLDEIRTALTRLFDVSATKDYGNTVAKADVVVDGNVLIAQAPPTYLLMLEKYLNDLRTVVSKLPVLDPATEWHEDEVTGLWKSSPVVTTRTRKSPRAHVLYQATDRHPAQVESFTVDEVIGDYTATKYSGSVSARRRDELVSRVETLLQAVKFAREEANTTTVEDRKVGERLFDYLLD